MMVSATDSGSAITKMKFSNDNSTWSDADNYSTSKSWPLASENGNKTVYVKFKDGAGNWSNYFSDTIIFSSAVVTAPAAPTPLNKTVNKTKNKVIIFGA